MSDNLPHQTIAGRELSNSPARTAVSAMAIAPRQSPDAHRLFRFVVRVIDLLFLILVIATLCCLAWAYSTQRYVDAFSDAVVPVSGSPEQKIQSILDWMAHPPARFATGITGNPNDRDPIDTLNYKTLLEVCGTATNAFVNLADTSNLRARRLLLLDADGGTKHVDAEVRVDGRWVVVDPTFRVILRGQEGQMLTRRELANPTVFREATRGISHYNPSYNFERTAHIRVAKIPLIGRPAGRLLDAIFPQWQDSAAISLIVERDSLLALAATLIATLGFFCLRILLHWYANRRLYIFYPSIAQRLRYAARGFMNPAGGSA